MWSAVPTGTASQHPNTWELRRLHWRSSKPIGAVVAGEAGPVAFGAPGVGNLGVAQLPQLGYQPGHIYRCGRGAPEGNASG
jgi:hypothetical protein